MQKRGAAWILSGLALAMMGVPAFGQYSLTNPTAITINNDTVGGGEAKNGYPSSVIVPGNLSGNLEKVSVTINGFTHAYPNDVVLLLVAPNGYVLPLMGNDGGGVSVNNLTLTFDDVAAGAGTLSTAAAITSGIYKSGDNAAYGTTRQFPAPAPAANQTSLAVFNGLAPTNYTGTWSLYVLDDSQPSTGSIASWSLNLYTQPTITVTNTTVTLSENTSTNFYFVVSDTTSNATLTPTIHLSAVVDRNIGYTNANGQYVDFISTNNVPADFVFAPASVSPNGTGVLTITPNANLYGTATFAIILTDGNGVTTTSEPISLAVTHVRVAPQIVLASTNITTSNGLATATNLISLVSLDGNPGSTLQFSVAALGLPNVALNADVFTNAAGLPSTTPQFSGRTNNFYFSIVPGGFPIGTNTIIFEASDPVGGNTVLSVAVIVDPLTNGPLAGPLVYTNTNSLVLEPTTAGALSTISLTNLTNLGLIGDVTVSLLGVTNIIPADLSLALQAPDGTLVPLIENPASGTSASTYAELTFSDSGGLPNVQAHNALPTGIVLTNYVLNAYAGGTGLASALNGHSLTNTGANNKWTLFVTNNSTSELGISGGWVLDVYPAPLVHTTVQTVTMPESATTNLVFVTSDTVGIQSGAPTFKFNPTITETYAVSPLATATAVTGGTATINGTNYTTNTVTLTGNPNEAGTATVSVIVSETNGFAGSTPNVFTATNNVTLTVTFVAQPPSIGFIENQVTFAGDAVLNVPFVVSSLDMDAANLTITVNSGNQGLLPTSPFQNNAVVTRGPSTGTPPFTTPFDTASTETNYISLFPVGTKGGQSAITITVTEGANSVNTSFQLVVGEAGSPLYYNPSPINITNNIDVTNATGTPYPSANVVSGLVGTVENVVVTVFDVTEGHNNAAGLNLLLVGPTNVTGQSPAVYLIGDAGVGTGLISANLIFSNSVSGPNTGATVLPQNSQIFSDNIYSPTNYGLNAYTTAAPLPAPAPSYPAGVTSYGTNLVSSFKGINPNGTWSLYAFDSSGNLSGSIFSGWQLSIITAPHVSPATTNYSTAENVPTSIVIPVGDAEAGNTSLSVTAAVTPSGASSAATITIPSPVLVTNNGTANLAVLEVTPVAYQIGTNNILVTATDSGGVVSATNLQFIVTYAPQAPVILVTNVAFSTPAAVSLNGIPFAVWDSQSTNQNTIQVSSTGLSPTPNITITTNGVVNGTNSYSLNFQPIGVGTGTASVTVAVIDGVGQTAKTNFTITVTPNLAFASTNSITLGPGYPANALASSYPWDITVPPNVGGLVSGVEVSLIGFTHNDASDVDVLLVSPDGQHSAVLMANAGNQDPVNNVNLEFSQSAGLVIPEFSQLANGDYLPSNYLSTLVFAAPAPSSGYSQNLTTAFAGVQPSGTWKLYVLDSAYPDAGSISSWILFLQTGPEMASIATPQKVAENGPALNVPLVLTDFSTALSNLTVAVDTGGNTNITVVQQGVDFPSGVTNLQFIPAPNYPSAVQSYNSTNLITVTVTDPSNNSVTNTFTLIVQYIPQAPVVSASTNNLVISENGSAQITFTVSDVDSYLVPANASITSTNPSLLVSSGLGGGIVTNSTIASPLAPAADGTITYTITPVANSFGTNQGVMVFSVMNTNNETTTTNITLSVIHVVQPPAIAPFFAGTYGIYPGSTTTNIPYSVTNLESGATLTIAGFSTSPSEVPNSPANIVISPASFVNVGPGTYTGTIKLVIPSGAPAGNATIWVTNTQVVAGITSAASASFNVAVLASPTTVFASTGPIANSITNPAASPYPSTVNVTGLVGGVFSASVTLNALSATVPDDVSILLQSPNSGPSVLLLSDAGGASESDNVTLTFTDTNGLAPANSPLAANGGSASYHPTSYNGRTNALPGAAPAPPYSDRMAVFDGISPNGTWSLWVVDNTTGNTVSVANGWTLSISTAPEIVLDTNPPPAALVIPENSTGQNNRGTVSFHVVDSTGSGPSDNVTVTSAPSSLFQSIIKTGPAVNNSFPNDYTATLTPAAFANGPGTLTFTVTRADGSSDVVTYPVSVTKSNIPPTLTRLGNISTNENLTGQSEFFVTQLGDPLSTVTVAVYSSNQAVVADSGLAFATGSTTANPGTVTNTNVVSLAGFASKVVPNAGDLVLNMTPVLNAVGQAEIYVYVTNSDGAFNSPQVTTASFQFTVTAATFYPTFANLPAAGSFISVIGGNTTNVSFQVNSLDAAPPVVTVSGVNLSAPNGATVGVASSVAGPNGLSQYNGTISNVAGSTWTVPISTVGPTLNQVKSTIQLTATDVHGLTTITNFMLITVPNQQRFYSNTAPINIVDVSPSIPSPSPINVSGLVGLISQVVVNVNGFGHQYPSDVGILLVGPNGSNTVLMNNAGSGVPVSGLNLTFSGSATGPVPASSQLLNATYLPSDYQPVKPYNFETSGINNPTPPNPLPPNGPYATNLNVFNGLNPNANWYLYVQDDSAGDVGDITGGWTLQIFTQPLIQITGLANLAVTYPAGGQSTFIILDDSAVAAINYGTNSFGVTSTNSTLIPPANVTFSGSGTNWTATFVPAQNVAGTSLITVNATNSYGQIASANFLVTVTPINIPPVFFLPTNGTVITIPAGLPTTIALGYSDMGFATNALNVSATSTQLGSQNPIPASSLSFVANGVGPSNLVVTPVGNVGGSNLITITVAQPAPGVSTAKGTFTLIVAPGTVPLFVNTNTITINADTTATPYPSQIQVTGVGSSVFKVSATLIGYSHTFPSDVSAVLVGPRGQSVMLMSDEGGDVGVSNLRLTFDDSGTNMPAAGPLTNGTYAPAWSDLNFTNNLADVILPNAPSNSPPNPRYYHDLSVFSNTSPNGYWSLYVFDDNLIDTGVLSGGWSLSIETVGPMITPIGPVTMSENTTATIPFSISSASTYASNITITPSAIGQSPANLVSSLVINGQGASNESLTITPTTNYPSAAAALGVNGTAIITLILTDTNNNASTNSFLLTVLSEDVAPTINLPARTNTPANVTLTVPFTINDVNLAGTGDLAVTASLSTNDATVDITTNGNGNYTLTFTPDGSTNQEIVSVVASDGIVSSTNTVQITMTAGLAPAISIVLATNTPENSGISVPFTLANVPAAYDASNVVGTASNTNLVASVSITGAGSSFAANITLLPYKTGSSVITITAQDQYGTGTGSTTLTVTPVEYPPTLAPISDTNTPANTPVSVVLNVTDVATSISNLSYSANISNPNVVGAVSFSFNGINEIATIIPATNKAGNSAITIIVSDGVASAYQAFAVTVTVPTPPTLGPIASQSTTENTAAQVSLNVTSPVTPVTNLIFSGSSTNTSLVQSVTFSFNGTNEVATITPVVNATGLGTVTVSVSDSFSTNSVSFALQVNSSAVPTLSAVLVNGVLKVTFTGTPGAGYNIQSSSDLKTWSTIATVTANASTGATEYDATVSQSTHDVFYRAESQ